MLKIIFEKVFYHLVASAFVLFAFGFVYLIVQTQNEQRDLTAQVIAQFDLITKEIEEDNKIIRIDNFPVKSGYISSNYGVRQDPFTGKQTMHNGLDIAAELGTKVYPVGKGVVTFSGAKAGFGNMVEIKHGLTVVSRYGHLKESLVHIGQVVDRTDAIALVGNTGRSTGPHLHLEVKFNGKAENPSVYLAQDLSPRLVSK